MTLNIYVMPITGVGTRADARRPKYLSTFSTFGWGMFDYGNEPFCMVGILDIDASTHTTLIANADVHDLPVNLDQQVAGARTAIQNNLEAVTMPGTWVQTTNTWRDVAQFVGAACQFAQRYQGQTGSRWFTGGVTLDTTFGSLPAGVRTAIQTTAQSFNFDTSGITGASTLRQIIQSAAQQYIAMGLSLILAGTSLYG